MPHRAPDTPQQRPHTDNANVDFNAMFTPDGKRHLEQTAKAMNCSQAHVVRLAVESLYFHARCGVPTCPNGQACHVPHMHPQIQKTALAVPEL